MMTTGLEPAWRAQANELMAASAPPMIGGAGRITRLRAALEVLNPFDRQLLLEALDDFSRQLASDEIDAALIPSGLASGDRKRLIAALKDFPVLVKRRARGDDLAGGGEEGRLARMKAVVGRLNALDRELLLAALRETSQPMTAREIEEALIPSDLSRTDRRRLVMALKSFLIIMVARP